MKFKKEYVILVVVIAALALYLTTRSLNQGDEELPRPADLEAAGISRLVLNDGPNTALELVKKDERWFIEPQGYPADKAKVTNMVNAISELTLTALVSESGSYDRYGLTAEDKIRVQAFSGGAAVRVFSVGKPAPTFQHTFVLLDSDPNVYHARGQLERTFDQSVDSLRDKTIFDVEKEDIAAVTIRKGEAAVSLAKKEVPQPEAASADEKTETPDQPPAAEWQDADGRAVDQEGVARLLDEIDHLDCDSFLAEEARAALGESLWTVTFQKGAETFSLSVHPKLEDGADKLPATASTTPYAFLLNQTHVESMEKNLDVLLGVTAAGK